MQGVLKLFAGVFRDVLNPRLAWLTSSHWNCAISIPNLTKQYIPYNYQERLSDLIGPYWGTYGIVYRVLQPLLVGIQQHS